jgi:lipopolysaccharide/colanic/teichoic acid biosynthesis glycosyltransferase
LLAATLVVLLDGWPPFYKATRVGKNGREFTMWKIRTMVRDAEARLDQWRVENPDLAAEFASNFKLADDPRITSFGRFLRRCSLDELPQLWSVVKGDMTLVGPRPIVKDELLHYGPYTEERLASPPGVTGLWQLGGRNRVTYPERTWLELHSCRSVSLKRDLSILARTLLTPFRFNGL